MEGGFQAMLLRGEGCGDESPAFTGQTTDGDASINALYSAMNAHSSSLSLNDENHLLQSLDYGGYGVFPLPPPVDPATFGYAGECFPASRSDEVSECSSNRDWTLKPVDFVGEKLKMPKEEAAEYESVSDASTEPFDFISKSFDSFSGDGDTRFHQLPDLQSVEQAHDLFGFAESARKRVKSFSPPAMTGRSFEFSNYFTGLKATPEVQPAAAAKMLPQSALARQRRQRISDKTRCLQKLLPWDKKMDMATMLEEAYKYIRFLKAQISVLQSMPSNGDSNLSARNTSDFNVFGGGLGRLNRQQLLQVMVNSQVVQTSLCSKGLCVYSVEQLVHLKKVAERKALYRQLVLNPSMFP